MRKIENLNQIRLPEELDTVIKTGVKAGLKKGIHHPSVRERFRMQSVGRKAAIILLALLLGGGLSITSYAVVRNLVEKRMEQVPKEEKENIIEELDKSREHTDQFSRPFTEEEQESMKQMTIAYQKGTFPKGELLQIQEESQRDMDRVCYLGTKQCYYLPERALTEEDLLEIIDFQTKMDYALRDRREEWETEGSTDAGMHNRNGGMADRVEKKSSAENTTEKITEAEAIKIASQWAQKLYPIKLEDYQMTNRLDRETYVWKGYDAVYEICYGISGFEYYYIYLNAWDGALLEVVHTDTGLSPQEVTLEELKESLPERETEARNYLKEQLQVEETFTKVTCNYVEENGKINSAVQMAFDTEGHTTYVLQFVDGKLTLYSMLPQDAYEEYLENYFKVLPGDKEWKTLYFDRKFL
ncbi:MAG: hypothetical protein PHE02_09690 [Lachnospiraceae bacterium]|nr:hypothetical protein [Lachnospiraceae bacterium]